MKQYVIIGNGIAAAGCIEGIRSRDGEGKITVISKEAYPVYCRPLISYYLEGKSALENIPYRPADFYSKNDCEVRYGESAVKIDGAGKRSRFRPESSYRFPRYALPPAPLPLRRPLRDLTP